MRIIDIEIIHLPNIAFPAPIAAAWLSGGTWKGLDITLVRIHTDSGLVGVGADAYAQSARLRTQAVPALLGQDPLLIEKHVQTLGQVGGVWLLEMALWDLAGKASGLPLYRLWGGCENRILAYASLCRMGTPEERAEDAIQLYEAGFRAVKLRLHHDTMGEDIALVRAVRDAVGNRMEIMVDANQANIIPSHEAGPQWDLERAIWTAKALENLDVTWLEEPLRRHDYDGLAKLCQRTDMAIAGGEHYGDLKTFQRICHMNSLDVLQPELLATGVSNYRKIAHLAEATGRLCIGHHGRLGLGLVTLLHLSAAHNNAPYVEFLYEPGELTPETFQGLQTEPLWIDEEGYLQCTSAPGLGITIDDRYIARHRA